MDNILSVLILNRNNSDDLINIYNDLKKQTFQDFHLIVIDDNSDKSELEKLLRIKEDRFMLYSYPSPWKFGNDNKWNMGLKKAKSTGSKYTYSIQTDMKINSKNLLQRLVGFMENNEKCGAACPTIYNKHGIMTWGPGIEKVRMGKTYNINETFITRNRVMEEMNYINNKLIYFGSEVYFNNQMKLMGYTTSPIEGISVTHFGGGTSAKSQYLKDYYRPRTTILILKLFNNDDKFLMKLRYLFWETSEQRSRIINLLKNFKLLDFIKVFVMFNLGLIAGFLISVESKHNNKKH
jgi:GT2 family glycosyltransferase